MIHSTIARRGETPVAWGSVCGSWGALPKDIVQSAEAKGKQVHYLGRRVLPLVSVTMSASGAMSGTTASVTTRTGNRSHCQINAK